MAKERRGIDLIIQKTDAQQVKGELIAVKENSLLLKESSSGADITAVVSDMRTIIIVKKSKALEQGGLGLLIGGGLGALSGLFLGSQVIFDNEWFGDLRPAWTFYGGAFGAGLGLILGGIFGALLGKDETLQTEGKSESEIKDILKELRKKARVPNFQ
jgi:hypothetical protein